MTHPRAVDLLEDVGDAYCALLDAETRLDALVIQARKKGATWGELAHATDRTKQAAWARWHDRREASVSP